MPWGLTTQKIRFTEVRLRALHAIVTMTIITWIIKLTCFTQELWTNSKAESVFCLVLNKNVFNHFIWCFSVLRPASKTLDLFKSLMSLEMQLPLMSIPYKEIILLWWWSESVQFYWHVKLLDIITWFIIIIYFCLPSLMKAHTKVVLVY